MTTESVEIILTAQDEASAKLIALQKQTDKNVRSIKEVGGQSKASSELVGTLANSLGGTGVGAFAGEISMLTERVGAFSEVIKTGGAGALAFKAGLAGAAAVISFKVGKAIGDAIFKTEEWTEKLEEATEAARKLEAVSLGQFMDRVKGNLTTVETNLKNTTERLQSLKKAVETLENSGGDFAVYDSELQSRIESKKAEVAATKAQVEALNNERLAIIKNNAANKQQITDKNAALLKSLQSDVRKAASTDFIERTRLELKERGVLDRSMEVAISLVVKKQRLEEAAANKKAIAAQKAIADEKAIADAEKARLKARRDGLDAIIKKESEVTKNLKEQVADLKKNDKSTLTGPLQAGASQRLATGRASGEFKKTAAVIEAERQTKIQKAQEKLMAKMAASLQRMEKAQTAIKVLGN